MWRRCKLRSLGWVMAVLLVRLTDVGAAEDLPTGQRIEPRAARGAAWQDLSLAEEGPHSQRAGQAVSLALSPDGRTLLVLTSGYNLFFDEQGKPIPDASQEHVFLFDVSRGSPHRLQTVPLPNSFCGIAWSPEGKNFYVSGGGDDSVHAYAKARSGWREVRPPLRLDHLAGNGLMTQPVAAGVAIDPDGKRLLVANWANDSVSLVDLGGWRRSVELDLRPGKISADSAGIPGGEYPFWVAWCGRGRAYVSSVRDRELVVLDVGESSLKVRGRIPLHGQPNRILAVPERSRAYVACDNSDTVVVLDTEQDRILEEIDVLAPVGMRPAQTGKGANPNGLALTPDGRMLLVSCGGTNAIAVLRLGSLSQGKKEGEPASELLGLIPTGWYPSSVAVGRDGGWLYVCNAKSPAGPNAEGWHPPRSLGAKPLGASERARNQYVWQRTLAGLLSLPLPDEEELRRLTRIVAENNGWRSSSPDSSSPGVLFSTLRRQIHHVIYVVKENRTYDQLLGDLGKGNGDPSLAILAPYSPNHQQIARRFVLLDNFYDSGEVSGDGWQWSTAARTTETTEKTVPLHYARRGPTYDWEGNNRNVPVGLAPEERREADPLLPRDPDLLPGPADAAAPDSVSGEAGAGFLWDAALRRGLSIRNYGFFGELGRYFLASGHPGSVPLEHLPFAAGCRQFFPVQHRLIAISDPFYRGFDMRYPDYWRFREWQREFGEFCRSGTLPALELVRLPHDHFGSFREALDGVNTVETQMADNDYALGLLIEAIARSRYRSDTLIFVLEDDAQDGVDHVDAHRSIAFVVGPYVRKEALVSTRFTTVSLLRTLEEVLGLPPLGIHDAAARPMEEIFSLGDGGWDYQAVVPAVLRSTALPLPGTAPVSGASRNRRSAAYWEQAMAGESFEREDQLHPERFNQALWTGLKGEGIPYPALRRSSKANP